MSMKNVFIELFESGCSVEVDGCFCRHFNEEVIEGEVKDGTDREVISFDLIEIGGGEVSITSKELDSVKLSEDGIVWDVAGFKFIFYSVEPIQIANTPLVNSELK